jgi:hypothetical protein
MEAAPWGETHSPAINLSEDGATASDVAQNAATGDDGGKKCVRFFTLFSSLAAQSLDTQHLLSTVSTSWILVSHLQAPSL